jgi:hypothetical protein
MVRLLRSNQLSQNPGKPDNLVAGQVYPQKSHFSNANN